MGDYRSRMAAGGRITKTIFAGGQWTAVCRSCGWRTKPVAKRSECASQFRLGHLPDDCPSTMPGSSDVPPVRLAGRH
jgi:hypothetical protein